MNLKSNLTCDTYTELTKPYKQSCLEKVAILLLYEIHRNRYPFCCYVVPLILLHILFVRKRFALPEDIEYFNIQQQMNFDLFDEYREVERIICKLC